MTQSLDILLAGIVDYAGLFPPAELGVPVAVAEYARYREDPARAMLGRFVVPSARLDELSEAACESFPRAGAEPWRISALVGADVARDVQRVEQFNHRHSLGAMGARAVVDSLEIRIGAAGEIGDAMAAIPARFLTYFEMPVAANAEALVAQIAQIVRSGARAKIRTGGVTPDAFPATNDIVRFLRLCSDAGVGFKATAGLHHPLRGDYRLTYAPNSACAVMYGYLNVFLAAAFVKAGANDDIATRVLEETDSSAFAFEESGAAYRGARLSLAQLAESRDFAISFGSCSFREPVDDLAALGFTQTESR